MGVHKFTYEELKAAHRRQEIKLMHARAKFKEWKARAKDIEDKIKTYVFIDKKPDYYFSFSGLLIFRRWVRVSGLTDIQAEFLIIMSYQGMFANGDYGLYSRNYVPNLDKNMDVLAEMGYVVRVKIPGKSMQKKWVWVLTQKGKDFEADYERFYDKKMEELKAGKLTPFHIYDGAYYRKKYVTKNIRRIEQGGGMLPKRPKAKDVWREINPIQNDENNKS